MAQISKAPYTVPTFCFCKKEIRDDTSVRCNRCDQPYCSEECRLAVRDKHVEMCETMSTFNMWFQANRPLLSILGLWYRLIPDNSYVGMMIEWGGKLDDACKLTPVEAQSLEILLAKLGTQPLMYRAGYPDTLCLVVQWGQWITGIEIDMTVEGKMLHGRHESFDTNALKFMVSPKKAQQGKINKKWYKDLKIKPIDRLWLNFRDWRSPKFNALPAAAAAKQLM